jgi:DcmR-like sensory protein
MLPHARGKFAKNAVGAWVVSCGLNRRKAGYKRCGLEEAPVTNLAHLVQFYGDDDVEIVGNAAAFLDGSLLYGGGAVVVGTESHREALMRTLAGDAATAIKNRLLIFKDAAEVLDCIVENGFPSAARFDAILGVVMREMRSRCDNAPVHAFAEMGALLWKAGQYPSAIRLEQLWNSLQRRVSFKLYSTYAIDVTDPEFDPDALQTLLRAHSRLVAATPPKPEEISA